MAALETPQAKIGWKAADFKLKATDGKTYSLADVKGANGLLVMFICNHCPYVKAIMDRLISDSAELQKQGIGVIAINANDTVNYPDDSFDNMKKLATEKNFPFPYAIDETQEVARAYGAVCTPDFFGFDKNLQLQYRGRLDESWSLTIPNPRRELLEAMKQIATAGKTDIPQYSSMGCSIKWKQAAA